MHSHFASKIITMHDQMTAKAFDFDYITSFFVHHNTN